MGTQYVDYTFEFGKYRNMNETKDKSNFKYKLNALVNIIHTQPGTLQDNPYLGIDTSGLQYAETNEIDEKIAYVRSAIQTQSDRYIDQNFLKNIEIELTDAGLNDGSKEVKMILSLEYGESVAITSISTKLGLTFKTITPVNPLPF